MKTNGREEVEKAEAEAKGKASVSDQSETASPQAASSGENSVSTKPSRKRWKIVLKVIGIILYWFVLMLSAVVISSQVTLGGMNMEEVIFHMTTPQDGTPPTTYLTFFGIGILLPALVIFITLSIPKWLKKAGMKQKLARIIGIILVIATVGGSLIYTEDNAGPLHFIRAQLIKSPFIEENYVDPATVDLKFPSKKMNVVTIFLESMESSFMDVANGGCNKDNVIVPLTELAKENVNFSWNDKYGGFRMITTATYTIGSQVMQSGALPLFTPLQKMNDMNDGPMLPGMINLGDILAEHGYQNVFVSGSSARFGNQKEIFIQHGNYQIHDLDYMMREGIAKKDAPYMSYWGVIDSKLFEVARTDLTRLGNSDKPFNIMIETMDTHGPKGRVTAATSHEFDDQYSNVLAGSAQQAYDLVRWIQEQPWGANTMIYICGDHQTMDPTYHERFVTQDQSQRSVYDCFINPAIKPAPGAEKDRECSALDIFPTILAGIGVKIPGDRLGLGVDLFSGEKTLLEKYGIKKVDQEFEYTSPFYTNRFIYGEKTKHGNKAVTADHAHAGEKNANE